MTTKKYTQDKLSTVTRMLSYCDESNKSVSSSFDEVRSALPSSYDETIALVEGVIQGKDFLLKKYRSSYIELLCKLTKIVRAEGGDVVGLIGSQGMFESAAIQAKEYWNGFSSLISYMISVLVITILVTSMFVTKVLPQFQETFSTFGAELPMLTKFVLGNELIFTGLILFMFLVIVLSALFFIYIKERVSGLSPLSAYCRFIPGFMSLYKVYGYFLFVQYLNVLNKSKLSDEIALKNAEELSDIRFSGEKLSAWFEVMKVSGRLGSIEKEINYQNVQIYSLLTEKIISVRNRMTLFFRVFLSALIGLLVVAMYLPIFMLGSVV